MDAVALMPLTDRARYLACQLTNTNKQARCLNMIETLLDNPDWPDLKIGGWLEHIITVCIENGVTTIDKERVFSRLNMRIMRVLVLIYQNQLT